MKIAAFYENIKLGIETSGVTYEEALTKLKGDGLELLYADYKILKQDYDFLIPIIEKLDIGFEGLYGFFDFAHDSEDESY